MSLWERYRQRFAVVKGWFPESSAAVWDCLLTFQRESGIRGDLMEVGVWKGKSAGMLALHCGAEERCLLVDPRPMGAARDVIAREVPGVACKYVEEPSEALWRKPFFYRLARSFRWVHLDGEHSLEGVIEDLRIADHLLSARGLVSLDDFFSPAYPQVTEAVYRYLSATPGRFSLMLCGFKKGYLCRPRAAGEYLEFCRHGLNAEMARRGFSKLTIWNTEPTGGHAIGITERFENFEYRGPDSDYLNAIA